MSLEELPVFYGAEDLVISAIVPAIDGVSVRAPLTKLKSFRFAWRMPANRTDKPPTLAVFAKLSKTMCQECGGVMSGQYGNRIRKCLNARMEPITCNDNVLLIEVRKRNSSTSGMPKYEARLDCQYYLAPPAVKDAEKWDKPRKCADLLLPQLAAHD